MFSVAPCSALDYAYLRASIGHRCVRDFCAWVNHVTCLCRKCSFCFPKPDDVKTAEDLEMDESGENTNLVPLSFVVFDKENNSLCGEIVLQFVENSLRPWTKTVHYRGLFGMRWLPTKKTWKEEDEIYRYHQRFKTGWRREVVQSSVENGSRVCSKRNFFFLFHYDVINCAFPRSKAGYVQLKLRFEAFCKRLKICAPAADAHPVFHCLHRLLFAALQGTNVFGASRLLLEQDRLTGASPIRD